MQMVSEVMTRNVQFVTPQENLLRAAQMMDELNVGALPVCDGDHLVGMLTDRDITVRGTAAGRAPNEAKVEDVMSGDVRWCFEDQSLDEVMQQMADSQIRRVPVVSHDEQHKLIGIVALGDIATKTGEGMQANQTEQLVEKISSPSEPDMSQQGSDAASGTGMAAGSASASPAAGMRQRSSGADAGSTPGAGAQGYEGDVGLAGAAGATSNIMGNAGNLADEQEGDKRDASASSSIGRAPGGDIG